MTEQRSFVDFRQGGDSGDSTSTSIQPVGDGEGATSTVFRRPSENIRGRTEVVRDALRELFYYRDYSSVVMTLGGGGDIAWDGTVASGGTGVITHSTAITVRPMLSPTASQKGSLTIGVSGTNAVTYAVTTNGYATNGLDQVTVEHRDAGAGATLSATISDGPIKRILVLFDSANTGHDAAAVASAVNLAITGDATLNGMFAATAAGIASTTVAAASEAYVEGTADQEAHVLPAGMLYTFTSGRPLQEGDCVAIWYRHLVEFPETGVAGGRWESNPDRGTSTVPLASLFVVNDNPERIPGSIPLCRVVAGDLVFAEGTRIAAGTSGIFGSVSAGAVTVNPLNFTGADTEVRNGGIDTPGVLNVQQALDSIDTRLGQRRAFTYVCTDGTTSTGGNFDSPTAIQDAIAALTGTAGTLYVRRGTYLLPSAYNIPHGVSIIGENTSLVVLTQSLLSGITLTSNNTLQGVTVTIADNTLACGDSTHLRNVVINGHATFTHNCVVANTKLWRAAASHTISVSGNNNTFFNIETDYSVAVAGANNTVNGVNLGLTGATPNADAFIITGHTNSVYSIRCVDPTVVLASGASVVSVGGTNNKVESVLISASSSSITNNGYGVTVSGRGVVLRNAHVEVRDGSALHLSGSTVRVHVTDCNFSNNSTTAPTVSETGLLNIPNQATFTNCVFNQNAQTGHSLWTMTGGSGLVSDSFDPKFQFNACRFYAARLVGAAFTARNAQFYNCQFLLRNPEVGGVPRLGGTGDGQTTELFHFLNNCTLRECTIDAGNSEVTNDGGGNPTISAPLYVRLNNSKAYNLRLIQVNRHVYAPVIPYGFISLYADSVLDGLTLDLTSTSPSQGGTQSLTAAVTLYGDRVTFRNFYTNLTNWPGLATQFTPVYQPVTAQRFVMENIAVDAACGGFLGQDAGALLNSSRIKNITIGRASVTGASLSGGINFPTGNNNLFTDSEFHVDSAAGSHMRFNGNAIGCGYHNLKFNMIGAVGTADTVTGLATVTRGIFTNCVWYAQASGAGNRPFSSTMTFSDCAGAGNVHIYSGGTTTAPSFSANVNVW